MSEATEVAGESQRQPITLAEGVQRYNAAKTQPTNPISEAARTMGKAGAEARKSRQASPPPEPEAEPDEEEAGSDVEDTPANVEALNGETADGESSESVTETEEEPESQAIDLGSGITLTKDEIREGIMLKADYTRKRQADAEARREFDTVRTQRVQLLDTLIGVAQSSVGKPKSLNQWLAEDPVEGLQKYAAQQERFEEVGQLIQARQQEQSEHLGQMRQNTIRELAERHGDKAEANFSKAVQYVADKTKANKANVEAMLSHPDAVEMVLDAIAYRELQSKKGDVKKTIAEKPKVIRPGAKVSAQANQHNAIQNAHSRLKQSGSLADAVELLKLRKASRRG